MNFERGSPASKLLGMLHSAWLAVPEYKEKDWNILYERIKFTVTHFKRKAASVKFNATGYQASMLLKHLMEWTRYPSIIGVFKLWYRQQPLCDHYCVSIEIQLVGHTSSPKGMITTGWQVAMTPSGLCHVSAYILRGASWAILTKIMHLFSSELRVWGELVLDNNAIISNRWY